MVQIISTVDDRQQVDRHDVEAVNKAENRSLYASRVKIQPKSVSGTFRRLKWAMLIVLLGIYYISPWLRWDRGPGAPDQDRAVSVMDDVVRHAPDEEPSHGPAPVAADHHEVHLLAPGGVDDRLGRLALPDQEVDPDPGGAAARHEILRGSLAVGANLVHPRAEPATRETERPGIDDAHDQEVGTEVVREIERLEGRALRRRR